MRFLLGPVPAFGMWAAEARRLGSSRPSTTPPVASATRSSRRRRNSGDSRSPSRASRSASKRARFGRRPPIAPRIDASAKSPPKGYNRWIREWHLQSEPWTFLVGRDGRVKAKFEGSLSAGELTRAIESTLLS